MKKGELFRDPSFLLQTTISMHDMINKVVFLLFRPRRNTITIFGVGDKNDRAFSVCSIVNHSHAKPRQKSSLSPTHKHHFVHSSSLSTFVVISSPVIIISPNTQKNNVELDNEKVVPITTTIIVRHRQKNNNISSLHHHQQQLMPSTHYTSPPLPKTTIRHQLPQPKAKASSHPTVPIVHTTGQPLRL